MTITITRKAKAELKAGIASGDHFEVQVAGRRVSVGPSGGAFCVPCKRNEDIEELSDAIRLAIHKIKHPRSRRWA